GIPVARGEYPAYPSNGLRDDEGIAVLSPEHRVGLVVASARPCVGVEVERSAQAVRDVREVDQRGRGRTLVNRRVQVRPLAAPHGLDEVGPVVSHFGARRTRLLLFP